MAHVRKFRKLRRQYVPGGLYMRCSCGKVFKPVNDETMCRECRKKARYEECHKFAKSILVVV